MTFRAGLVAKTYVEWGILVRFRVFPYVSCNLFSFFEAQGTLNALRFVLYLQADYEKENKDVYAMTVTKSRKNDPTHGKVHKSGRGEVAW